VRARRRGGITEEEDERELLAPVSSVASTAAGSLAEGVGGRSS